LWGIIAGWLYLGEKFNWRGVSGIILLVVGLMVLSYGQTVGTPVSEQWYYAIPLALGAALTWGVTGVMWRDGQLRGADHSTAIFIQFMSKAIFTGVALILMNRLQLMWSMSLHDLGALLISGLLSGLVAQYCLFKALRMMSVARVYALNSLNPILAAILAYFTINEYINTTMFLGLLTACIGVVLVQVFKPKYERKAA
jgi:drug/metabolite transporter (DMT)-like permease